MLVPVVLAVLSPGRATGAQALWQPAAGAAPPGSSMLSGVSCWARESCWAVGSWGADRALAERWNGTGWSVARVPVAAGARGAVLNAVACRPGNCTAVGAYTDQAGQRLALVERWTSGHWHRESAPSVANATTSDLLSVSCASTTYCIAVGYDYAPPHKGGLLQRTTLVERWNGARWMIDPAAAARQRELGAVSCAARACEIVGSSTLRKGSTVPIAAEIGRSTAWRVQPVYENRPPQIGASFAALAAVSCASPTSCTAVGSSGDDTPVALIEHWNGASWRQQSSSGRFQDYALSGVSCPASRACMAVGSSYDGRSNRPFAEQWQGGAWTTQQTPAPRPQPTITELAGSQLLAVSCAFAGACLAVGYTRAVNGGRPALRALAVTSAP